MFLIWVECQYPHQKNTLRMVYMPSSVVLVVNTKSLMEERLSYLIGNTNYSTGYFHNENYYVFLARNCRMKVQLRPYQTTDFEKVNRYFPKKEIDRYTNRGGI